MTCVNVPLKFMLSLTNLNIQGLRLPATQNLNRRGLTDHVPIETCKELIVMQDRLSSHRDKDIAHDESTFGCWATVLYTKNKKSCCLLTLQCFLRSLWDVHGLAANTEI